MVAAPLEQYLLELVNSEREKAQLPPLALNATLSAASAGHNSWMIKADKFQHEGRGGSDPSSRIRAAGYILTGVWATGENIAWTSQRRSVVGLQDEVMLLHRNLMNSPVHRHNLLNPEFREIGLNLQIADRFQKVGGAVLVGQTFALSGPMNYLLGVVYVDEDNDGFYDPGEGVGGVEIVAVAAGSDTSGAGNEYSTRTDSNGAYKLGLSPDRYRVTYQGAGIDAVKEVIIGRRNVKLDLLKSKVQAALAVSRPLLTVETARVTLAPGFAARRPVVTLANLK